VALSDTFNEEQRATYDEIMSSVDTEHGVSSLWMVLAGPERLICIKHFLLLYVVRKKIAMATATSDVAASIMPSGRTAYSSFKIPLTICHTRF
jgi:hypothetical protein